MKGEHVMFGLIRIIGPTIKPKNANMDYKSVPIFCVRTSSDSASLEPSCILTKQVGITDKM